MTKIWLYFSLTSTEFIIDLIIIYKKGFFTHKMYTIYIYMLQWNRNSLKPQEGITTCRVYAGKF